MCTAQNSDPATHLYIAQTYDDARELTFKVGVGTAAEGVEDLNRYCRLAEGQTRWSERSASQFATVAGAKADKDSILREARNAGYGSSDHSELLVGISTRDLDALFRRPELLVLV